MRLTKAKMALCFLLLPFCALETPGQGGGMRGRNVVQAEALVETDGVHAGSMVRAAIVARIAAGFHINDHVPSLDYLIPTQLEFEPAASLGVDKVSFPRGEMKKFAFSPQSLSVYEGRLVVGLRVKIGATLTPGQYTLGGKLAYQACNDEACFPPAKAPFELKVKVVAAGIPLKPVKPEIFSKVKFHEP